MEWGQCPRGQTNSKAPSIPRCTKMIILSIFVFYGTPFYLQCLEAVPVPVSATLLCSLPPLFGTSESIGFPRSSLAFSSNTFFFRSRFIQCHHLGSAGTLGFGIFSDHLASFLPGTPSICSSSDNILRSRAKNIHQQQQRTAHNRRRDINSRRSQCTGRRGKGKIFGRNGQITANPKKGKAVRRRKDREMGGGRARMQRTPFMEEEEEAQQNGG